MVQTTCRERLRGLNAGTLSRDESAIVLMTMKKGGWGR